MNAFARLGYTASRMIYGRTKTQTPATQTCKMFRCFFEGKWSSDKSNSFVIMRERRVVVIGRAVQPIQFRAMYGFGGYTHVLQAPDTLTPRKLHTLPYESTKCRPLRCIPPVTSEDQACAYDVEEPIL